VNNPGLDSYIIRGGKEGRDRLAVLAGAVRPTTLALLDRMGPMDGATVVDAACGGGDVTFELAARVGAKGQVIGLDLDETKLEIARAEAKERAIGNVTFEKADVSGPWPVSGVDVVYARFILTHVTDPVLVLRRAREALSRHGRVIVEDIDIAGHFADPDCPALDRFNVVYIALAKRRGCDPFIGRRLRRHLEAAGFGEVGTGLVQPFGRSGDVKRIPALTTVAIAEGLINAGLASQAEVESMAAELDAFAGRDDTTVSMPRVFQAWGRRGSE